MFDYWAFFPKKNNLMNFHFIYPLDGCYDLRESPAYITKVGLAHKELDRSFYHWYFLYKSWQEIRSLLIITESLS